MKKTYVKPYVAVESFQLDAAIATSCSSNGLYTLGYSIDTCTLEDNKGSTEFIGLNYFGAACVHNVMLEGDGNDLICYHGPTQQANTLFMNS